jgi:hypothetical protein
VLIAIEAVNGPNLTAIYAIGPGIDKGESAEWSRRRGRVEGHELVFEQKGESTLRFRPSEDGGLNATWIAPDGASRMQAGLRRIDADELPITTAASAEAQLQ